MKKFMVTGFMVLFLMSGCSSSSVEDLKVLGTTPFSQDRWSSSSQEERGKMVFSLLKTHTISKMKVEDIQTLLGEPTAYYEYDEFPAYLIGPKNIKSDYGDGYLLAFPFDRKTGIVKKYIIEPDPKK